MRRLSEAEKFDAAIEYQALATPAPGITSRYFKLDKWCKAVFAVIVDTLALADTVVCEVWEDLVNTGATGAAIGGVAPTATATIIANTNATVVSITVGVVQVADTVTINGVLFTAAAAPDHPNQVFDQVSGVAATIATDLTTCINHAAAQALFVAAGGAITAAAVGAVVTLTATEAGEVVLTVVSSNAARLAIATVQAIAYIEVEDTALSAADSWVAINLVGPATANATAVLVRGDSRYQPVGQQVAASDTDS